MIIIFERKKRERKEWWWWTNTWKRTFHERMKRKIEIMSVKRNFNRYSEGNDMHLKHLKEAKKTGTSMFHSIPFNRL
jgi:hypothetical protein